MKYLKYAKTVKYEKKGKLREGRIYRTGERPGRRIPLRTKKMMKMRRRRWKSNELKEQCRQ